MISRRDFVERLRDLEKACQNGVALNHRELDQLKSVALHWGEIEHHTGPALVTRFARLLRRSRNITQQRNFLERARTRISNVLLDVAYSTVLAEGGSNAEALAILNPLLNESAGAELWAKAARLNRTLGQCSEAASQYQRAANIDSRYYADVISTLLEAEAEEEALEVAKTYMARSPRAASVLFSCYIAEVSCSASERDIEKCRSMVLEQAVIEGSEAFWQAKIHRYDRKYDEAIACLSAGLFSSPGETRFLKERAAVAIQSGQWGRYASLIVAARGLFHADGEIMTRIQVIDEFFADLGTTLEAAAESSTHASVRTPDVVFEQIVSSGLVARKCSLTEKLVIVANSLAPGGAERIVATLTKHLAPAFKEVRLYLSDLDARTSKDFYLEASGVQRRDVRLLDRTSAVQRPLNILPVEHGKTAQAILNQLQQDTPDVLYVALEPLTVFCGLAGVLAGVPRIILHTHNMPPSELHPRADFPERLRECYRLLLQLPQVSLLTCARAAAEGYINWLGEAYRRKVSFAYNGLDFSGLEPAPAIVRSELRAELGISNEHILVGTAFAFRDEKQPFLWIDAAEEMLKSNGQCRFVMYGSGTLWQAATRRIEDRKLSSFFTLPGLVSDLYRRLPALDLFMLSSRSEALPTVLIESQAAGVPVVSFDVGGAGETFLPGETGLLAQGFTASHLAAAATAAINDGSWLIAASKKGPTFVHEQFSLQRMVKAFSSMLIQGTS